MKMHVTLDPRGNRGVNIRMPYVKEKWIWEENLKDIKRALGTRWDKDNRTWYADGPEVTLDFERLGITYSTASSDTHRMINAFRNRMDAAIGVRAIPIEGMYGYQTTGSQYLYYAQRAVLADGPGLGKSKQTIGAVRMVWEEYGPMPTIIVVLNSLVYNWPAEFEKWWPGVPYAIPPGDKQKRIAFWETYREQWLTGSDDAPIIITNYEKLALDDFPDHFKFQIVAADEATYIKNPSATRSKAFFAVADRAPWVWLLTGTPIEIRYEELYGLFTYIRPAVFGSFTRFRDEHLVTDFVGNIIGARQLDLMSERIGPWILRRTKDDVHLQLPPKLHNDHYIELTANERSEYKRMNRDFELWLRENDGDPNTANVLTQLLRLQQFTSSPNLTSPDDGARGSKFEALDAILAEWDGRALIFSRFSEMADRIVAWLDLDPRAIIKGAVSGRERVQRVTDFNEGRLGKVLVSTDAGAHGLNVTSADLIVQYDMLWNPAKMFQREERLHRIGQVRTVNVLRLLVPNTVDQGMANVCDARKADADALLDQADEYIARRIDYRKIAIGEYDATNA
jgi:SNF2 family DNA or RNA helicase